MESKQPTDPTNSHYRPKQHPKYQRKFMNTAIEMTLKFVEETLQGNNRVIDMKQPQQLKKLISFQINEQGVSDNELLSECEKILKYQVKPYHPHFHNQLFGGFDQYSIVGSMMAPCINGTCYTYEVAPCFSIMEQTLYQHMRKIFQWDCIDAIFTPGGSFSNFYGIQSARFAKFPNVKNQGIFGMKPMQIFTSDVSHYSIKKGSNLCGIGGNNVIAIKTNKNGEIIPQELQKAIRLCLEQGNTPLMVNATVGTTVQGNIDPIEQIAQICQKYNVWLHVDAALGGSLWMSNNLKGRIGSCKKVDSICWDTHKALVVPLQSSFFFCRHKDLMQKSNSANADYLFHRERLSYDPSLDTGNKSLQCGRVIDILKTWVYFKGNGWKNIAKQIEMQCQLAQNLKSYIIKNNDRWLMAIEEVKTINICYWYIPEGVKIERQKEQFYELLSKVTVLAKKLMIEEGKMLVGYSTSKSKHYFWRNVMSNPYLDKQGLQYQMNLTASYCESAYKIICHQAVSQHKI